MSPCPQWINGEGSEKILVPKLAIDLVLWERIPDNASANKVLAAAEYCPSILGLSAAPMKVNITDANGWDVRLAKPGDERGEIPLLARVLSNGNLCHWARRMCLGTGGVTAMLDSFGDEAL
eukprot:CAMPEP_0196651868 /NCGR_PEP_ID=MMETSP1086-20130531/1043_1 /TAXON_ID=77921 /ORGANISM="Cyanoptyche  gloeocystis , Strain SAG4.97" /LENGTH=120 /DNA_ID=CAMNT_0041982149 /DNA_START=288 /DNA_END=649 /DNA_ORIENTATION=-